MKTRDKILKIAREILNEHPDGLRYTDLREAIKNRDKTLNRNTIGGAISVVSSRGNYKGIEQISRGFYRSSQSKITLDEDDNNRTIKEESFYKPFSDWLVEELQEADKAVELGGRKFNDKWATPDVIGKRQSKLSDIVQMPVEIVSAEIKADKNQLITAFGQACAYALFSHKIYLVIPESASEEERSKLDFLCQVFGIGLIMFNSNNIVNPNLRIRIRAQRKEPDYFYVNKYMRYIEKELFSP